MRRRSFLGLLVSGLGLMAGCRPRRTATADEPDDDTCIACAGKGKVKCVFCDGKGEQPKYRTRRVKSKETVKCEVCEGQGIFRCEMCDGRGKR